MAYYFSVGCDYTNLLYFVENSVRLCVYYIKLVLKHNFMKNISVDLELGKILIKFKGKPFLKLVFKRQLGVSLF